MKGDAMLSLVASIHLNEAMDGYIDRNKKGGDHSLSLVSTTRPDHILANIMLCTNLRIFKGICQGNNFGFEKESG